MAAESRRSTKVAVLGAGTWGTVVAAMLADRTPTVLWARREHLSKSISSQLRNPDYLSEMRLPASLRCTSDLGAAVEGADLVIVAIPSHGIRPVARKLGSVVDAATPVLSLAKGLERGSHLRVSQIILEEMGIGRSVGVLTGPNLAGDIAAGHPAASVVAMTQSDAATWVQDLLTTETFRVYTNTDLIGCELAGATKNVLAIGAGIVSGMDLGDSSMAALITRGLAELGRFVVAMGGQPVTVSGLAGVGDLVATCTSVLSRNRALGVELGRGRSLFEVESRTRTVAEGVNSARPLLELAAELSVEMPIAQQVADVLEGIRTPAEAAAVLMARPLTSEFSGAPEPLGTSCN